MWRILYLIAICAGLHFNAYPGDWEALKEYFTYRCEKGTLGYTINYGNCRPPAERPK